MEQTHDSPATVRVASVLPGPIVDERAFTELLRHRSQRLLDICRWAANRHARTLPLTRPLLGAIHAESAQLEELLDDYGARNNRRWLLLRELIAAAKNFASPAYNLVHLEKAHARYQLLPVRGDFAPDTDAAVRGIADFLDEILARTYTEAESLGLQDGRHSLPDDVFTEELPPGVLPRNRQTEHKASALERILHLATSFLDLEASSDFLHTAADTEPKEYPGLVPDPICEESVRTVEQRFHNLQSEYDTYVSDSDTEDTDPDLRVLRGHISVILHLMEMATVLAHFYERHGTLWYTAPSLKRNGPIDFERLLTILMGYCINYASRFLHAARGLCHAMLRRYAHVADAQLPVPRYRGFHVRPSTLIAKIVRHYGSDVTMTLGDESYDAESALELFRANEEVNAEKRRRLAADVASMEVNGNALPGEEYPQQVLRIVQDLAARGRIVIYQQPVELEPRQPRVDESLAEFALEQITHLLVAGKIDTEADLDVTFTGDERVLADLRVLAENGYCEDSFGNNLPIPPQLSYLRR